MPIYICAVTDRPPQRKPGPTPPEPGQPLNYIVDRRKVVFGVGFGVLSAASIRHLDTPRSVVTTNPRPADPTDTEITADLAGSQTSASPEDFAAAPEPVEPFEAPILDGSVRLQPGQQADVVLTGGRVIDPETGFDRIGNVALAGSTIVEISDQPIAAGRSVDVSGLVVSPGFIDILSYQPNGYGEWWKIADGVTTNLGMHGLRFTAERFYSDWEFTGVPINFGGAVHNSWARQQVGFVPAEPATAGDITEISRVVEAEVRAGYLGIHAQPEYAPGVSENELLDMGRMAASLGVPLCVHARFSDTTNTELQAQAIRELVDIAEQTGCHVHVEHLNSTGGTTRMAEALGSLEAAIDGGLRMSSCMYPYEFWATYLGTSRFVGWEDKYGLSFDDLQVAGTSERLTEDTYDAALSQNALTAAYAIPRSDLELGVKAPFMMIGSDAILETSHNNHPRSTGAFCRTIGEFSRNRGLISLVEALQMVTVRPANLAAVGSNQMARKGRLQIGADADITVFDANTIIDRSTLEDPAQESLGVEYVYVNGTEVRNSDGNVAGVSPGVAITSTIA